MINGAHVVIYTIDAEADRAFFRDVLQFPAVDAGHGWLIFALPECEAAFHPHDSNNLHQLYFMCDNLKTTLAELRHAGVKVGDTHEERWGILADVTLPGGGKIGVYEPKHARATSATKR